MILGGGRGANGATSCPVSEQLIEKREREEYASLPLSIARLAFVEGGSRRRPCGERGW